LKTAARFGGIAQALFVLIVLLFYWKAPDWMWMYYQNPAAPSIPLLAALVFVDYVAAYFLGFDLPRRLARYGRRGLVGGAVAIGALQLLLVALTWNRYSNAVSYKRFHNGDVVPLWESSLAPMLNGAFAGGGVAIAAVWLAARSKIRRTA
jgi:MFS family permease